MQVQRVNNNQPNFQAIKLSTVTNKARQIEIFSINEGDKAFINKILNTVEEKKFPDDGVLVGGNSVRRVFVNTLERAKNIADWANDRVLLAIEDGKRITGIMDVKNNADQIINGFAVINKDNLTRSSLVRSAVNETQKMRDFALILPSENASKTVKSFFRKMGFRTPKDDKNLMIECEDLAAANLKNNDILSKTVKIKDLKLKHNVDLAQYLNLNI